MTARAALFAAIFLVCSTCCISTAAQSVYSGFAVLPYNVEYALDMVCPTAGDVLGEIVLNAQITNQGATFAVARGSSLPLSAASTGRTSTTMVTGTTTTPSEYYFTIRCETTGGCAVNWDVFYYCKASTDTNAYRYSGTSGSGTCSAAEGWGDLFVSATSECISRDDPQLSWNMKTTSSSLANAQPPAVFGAAPPGSTACSISPGGSMDTCNNGLKMNGICYRCSSGSMQLDDPSCYCTSPTNVNGGWSDYGTCGQSSCSLPGRQERTCTNPAPLGTGASCVGSSTQACTSSACGGATNDSSTGGGSASSTGTDSSTGASVTDSSSSSSGAGVPSDPASLASPASCTTTSVGVASLSIAATVWAAMHI